MNETKPRILPNIVREHMLARGAVHAAMLLDGLYLVGAAPTRDYTIADMLTILAPTGMSEKVIRSGAKCLVFRRGLLKGKGRAAITYTLPTPAQVRTWYLLFDESERADVLPVSAFKSANHYRKALHVAMVKRLTEQARGAFKMARQKMATRLNVCINTIRNYEANSHIKVTQHITASEITAGNYWGLPAANMHNHSQWLVIRFLDGRERNYPLVSAIAAQAINAGCRVWKMTQHSNYYAYSPPKPHDPPDNSMNVQ